MCKQFTALLAQPNCLIDNSWMCNTTSYEYMSTTYQCQIITGNKKVSRNAKKRRVNSRVKNLNPLKSKYTDAEELWGHNNELRQSWALNIMLIFSSTVLFLDSSTALQSLKYNKDYFWSCLNLWIFWEEILKALKEVFHQMIWRCHFFRWVKY